MSISGLKNERWSVGNSKKMTCTWRQKCFGSQVIFLSNLGSDNQDAKLTLILFFFLFLKI